MSEGPFLRRRPGIAAVRETDPTDENSVQSPLATASPAETEWPQRGEVPEGRKNPSRKRVSLESVSMPHVLDSAIKRPVRAFLESLQSHRRHLALVPSERQNLEVHKKVGLVRQVSAYTPV